MSDLATLLSDQARRQPRAPALLATGRTALSYSALWQQAERCAATLAALGVGPSTRVALVLDNGPEMAAAFISVAACATCAPLNPAYLLSEFRFYLEDTRAQIVVVRNGAASPVRLAAAQLGLPILELDATTSDAGVFDLIGADPAAATKDPFGGGRVATPRFSTAGDTALILHTSGTTGGPKIVPLTQANLIASAANIANGLLLTADDRCLNVMPLFHIHGLVGALLATLAGGGSIVCAPQFDAGSFFDRVAEFNPTWYSAVPTMHQALVAAGEQYRQRAPGHRFRFVRSSSAALPPSVFQALQRLYGAPVIESYGMTEASHQMASNPLPPGICKPGSVGRPAGVDIAILDAASQPMAGGLTGEIAIRGPGVTAGYENNPAANALAFTGGWFRTGDEGRFDEDGYLFISGRLKESINRGGEKIAPREIDEALLEHPDVEQAAAFAVPHPTLGEDVSAAVVLKPAATTTEAGLREFLFTRLAGFKVPSQLVLVDAIPKGATGKVQRASLHKLLAPQLSHEYVAPRDQAEQTLVAIICEVLKCEPIGIHDNFFAIGGNSLTGTAVIVRVNNQFNIDMPVVELFRHPSVAELAHAVHEAQTARNDRDAALAARIDRLTDEEVLRLLAEVEGGDSGKDDDGMDPTSTHAKKT